MKTLIFKLSKDSQPYEREIITNISDTKINAHSRYINYTDVHLSQKTGKGKLEIVTRQD